MSIINIAWKIIQGIGAVIAFFFGIFVFLGGTAIHLYTVLMAYGWSGFGAAFLTFIFPLISTIFWFVKVWIEVGSFWNFYCVMIVFYVIVTVVGYSIVFIVSSWEEKRDRQKNLEFTDPMYLN